jgi:hypothetical protein
MLVESGTCQVLIMILILRKFFFGLRTFARKRKRNWKKFYDQLEVAEGREILLSDYYFIDVFFIFLFVMAKRRLEILFRFFLLFLEAFQLFSF